MQAGAMCLGGGGGGKSLRESPELCLGVVFTAALWASVWGTSPQARGYVLYPCHPQASLQFLVLVISHFPESAGPSHCGDSPLCDHTGQSLDCQGRGKRGGWESNSQEVLGESELERGGYLKVGS